MSAPALAETGRRATLADVLALAQRQMGAPRTATSFDSLIPSGHGVSEQTLTECILPFEIEFLAGYLAQQLTPPPADFGFALAAYAANLALKFCPPYLESPPDLFFQPNVEGNCAYDLDQHQTSATYQHSVGLFSPLTPTLTDDRLFGPLAYLFVPNEVDVLYSPFLPHYWGEVGRPDVFHFNSSVDLALDSNPGQLVASRPLLLGGDTYRYRVGTHGLDWSGDTLLGLSDLIFIYVPGGFKWSEAVSVAVDLGLIAAGEVLPPEPHGVFNIVDQRIHVYDTVPPTIDLNEDEATYPPRTAAVLSVDPASGIFTIEAIEPGGISQTAAIGFLDDVVETADRCDTSLTLTNQVVRTAGSRPPSAGFWRVGEDYDVTWTVTDPGPNLALERNSASVVQGVEVRDTNPPILLAPPSLVIESTTDVSPDLGGPQVFDLVDLEPEIGNDAPASFGSGISEVTWTATDAAGNAANATQLVNVKAPGSNTRPTAHAQSLAALSFEPLEIVLTGFDPDEDPGSGRHDPLSFHILDRPENGFFVAPLLPYFIDDYRIEKEFCADDPTPANCQAAQTAICEAFEAGTGPDIGRDFVNRASFVSVDDEGFTYVIDIGLRCSGGQALADNDPRIAKFGPEGEFLGEIVISGPGDPDKIYFGDGSLWTIEPESGSSFGFISQISPQLGRLASIRLDFDPPGPDIRLVNDPTAIAVDSQGILYAADSRVLYAYDSRAIDPSTNRPDFLGALHSFDGSSFFASINLDMAVDADDNLYVSDRAGDRIYKFGASRIDESGAFVPGQLIGWLGKCDFGDDCDVVKHRSIGFSCTDATCGVVPAPNPDPAFCLPFIIGGLCTQGSGPGQFDEPRGIAVDPKNVLYVTDYNNFRVQRFSPEGFFAGEAVSAGQGFGFVLGDFGRPRDVSVNSTNFYILNRDQDLLHVFETSPITPLGDDSAHVTYQSDNNFVGVDTFSFNVTDGLATSAPAIVTIDVDRNFRPPEVEDGLLELVEDDGATPLPIVAEDPDGDFDILICSATSGPESGTASFDFCQAFYEPDPDFAGTDVLTYVATDGVFTSEPATITIQVAEVNDRPALSPPEGITAGLGFPVALQVDFTDPDTDELHTVTVEWGDGTFEPEGIIDAEGNVTGPLVVEGVGGGSVVASHVYTVSPGSRIEVCVTDRMEIEEGDKFPTAASLTGCTQIPVAAVPMADLSLELSGPGEPVLQGGFATYLLTVRNNAPQAGVAGLTATGITLVVDLPDGADLVSSTPSQGSCSVPGRMLRCELGELAVGEDAVVALTLQLDPGLAPGAMLELTAGVNADPQDPSPMNIAMDVTTVVRESGNDLCSNAALVPDGGVPPFADFLDTTDATADLSDPSPSCVTGSDGATVWYSLTAPREGFATVSTAGSDYDTVVSVWHASEGCGSLTTELACDDDSGPGSESELTFQTVAGETYLLQVGSRNSGPGGELVVVFAPEPNATLLVLAGLAALTAIGRRRRGARRRTSERRR